MHCVHQNTSALVILLSYSASYSSLQSGTLKQLMSRDCSVPGEPEP